MQFPVFQYKLSDRCDFRCDACKLWQRDTEEEFPDVAEVFKDLEYLKKKGVRTVNFTGGDPLLHPHIVEILGKAKALKMRTAVTTPGLHYIHFRTGLKGLADLVIFLLYSPDPDEHNRISGVDSFEGTMDAIAYAKENKQKVMISYNVTRDNVQFIPEAYELSTSKNTLLWLNPLPVAYDVGGFEPDSVNYIRYYGKRPKAWLNMATIWQLTHGNRRLRERSDCLSRDEIITYSEPRTFITTLLSLMSYMILRFKLAGIR